MRRSSIIGLPLVVICVSSSFGASPIAIYNPATGNVSFSSLSYAGSISINSSVDLLSQHAMAYPPDVSVSLTFAPKVIDWLAPNGFPTSFNAGNILPPGTPASAFFVPYSETGNGRGFGSVIQIPEPSTAALLVIGCAVALVARRR